MIARSRVQEKLPHILGAIVAFGVALAALYSQWEFNQFLYQHREVASNAVGTRIGMWSIWATMIFVGLAFTPGFKFKRMQKLALIPLIILSFLCFGLASVGEFLAAGAMTLNSPADMLGNAEELAAFKTVAHAGAVGSALAFGLPALAFAVGLVVTFVISQTKKVQKRSEDNLQDRTGIMTLIAVCLPAVVYSAGTFLVASNELGLDRAVLLFNCGDLIAMFFLLCATMSLLGVPANFPKPPKPVKPVKEKKAKKDKDTAPSVPAESNPNMLDQQQAYAQAYAQQLYAQQQAYAQYYAQQQQAAAQAQQVPQAQASVTPEQQGTVPQMPQAQSEADPAAVAAYQQQQAQYYAQQQAYAAYQQQQQAYQQAYAAQQQYAQNQQQTYAQAYAQQQTGYQQQHQAIPTGTQPTRVAPRPAGVAGVKKIGGVRPIKKVR